MLSSVPMPNLPMVKAIAPSGATRITIPTIRKRTCPSASAATFRSARQRGAKPGAGLRARLHAQRAAVRLHDRARNEETEAEMSARAARVATEGIEDRR